MIREVVATLTDAARFGDWRGHLVSLGLVLAGIVTPDTRAGWPAEQREGGLRVWFRDEVSNILRAVCAAQLAALDREDLQTSQGQSYRAGVIDTVRAIAAAFGLVVPVIGGDRDSGGVSDGRDVGP